MSIPKCLDFNDFNRYPTDENPTTDADMQNYMGNQNELMKNVVDALLWQPQTNYAVEHIIYSPNLPAGFCAVCKTGGRSGNTEPAWSEDVAVYTDGNVVWNITSMESGGYKIVNELPNLDDAKENVVYFVTSENMKGYIKNGDQMVVIVDTEEIEQKITNVANDLVRVSAKVDNIASKLDEGGFTILQVNNGNNVTNNSRYVLSNPFPNYYVGVQAEIYVNGMWGRVEWSNAVSNFIGVSAFQINVDDIVVQTAKTRLTDASVDWGNGFGLGSGTNINSAPCRVKVWKVGKAQ